MDFGNGANDGQEMAYDIAYQPDLKPEAIEHQNTPMAVYDSWSILKLQVSYFHQIVAIPYAQYVAWSADEKATIINLMK